MPAALVVTGNGTTPVELIRNNQGHAIGEIYPAHRRTACELTPA